MKSKSPTVEKFIPKIKNPPAKDIEEAKRVAMMIVEAFSANFQNTETDLALMITDKFILRS